MDDAISAYIRVIEAHESISGIFNIASGNYTVGEVGDLVKAEVEQQYGGKINMDIRHMQDFRNYKVSFEKAKNVLSFHPQHDVRAIVRQLTMELWQVFRLGQSRFTTTSACFVSWKAESVVIRWESRRESGDESRRHWCQRAIRVRRRR